MTTISAIAGLDPLRYERSPLHADDRLWPEKNCYVDIWIEVLHALGMEPRAILPFVLAMDFEGDQWTFFKPPHGELFELYGIDVQELTVWKSLLEHVAEHVTGGKLISTEADSYWLPDTSGTDYRRNHVKSTIVVNAVDLDTQTMDYFHNGAYHRLIGEDFRGTFRVDVAYDPAFLPLFAELVRVDRTVRRPLAELASLSKALVRKHLARRPAVNPVLKFGERFERDIPYLQEQGLAFYHQWAFGGLRQLGAGFELAALNLRWLATAGALQTEDAATAFESISSGCKALILKGARAVNSRRPLDVATPCSAMAEAWDTGMRNLERQLG